MLARVSVYLMLPIIAGTSSEAGVNALSGQHLRVLTMEVRTNKFIFHFFSHPIG